MSFTIGVTGSSGYVGSRLVAALAQAGHEVTGLAREPRAGERRLCLGEQPDAALFSGLDVLVHCAWDMRATTVAANESRNVAGSQRLFDAALAAGVSRIIFISSMSAFAGCRSQYGQAKLRVEQHVLRAGGLCIRPGLIYGPEPGGIVGKLVALSRRSPVLPMVGFGNFRLHSCHEDDLAALLVRCCEPDAAGVPQLITAAETTGRRFRDIIATLAGRRLRFVPVPWQLAWLGLRLAESVRLPVGLKSDSLIGLVYSDPAADFGPLDALGIRFRELQAPVAGHNLR